MKDCFPSGRRRPWLTGLLIVPVLCAYAAADSRAAEPPSHDHGPGHHHSAMTESVRRSDAVYEIPALTLVRQDGVAVDFPQAIDDGRPVFLNFIYTSCTAICPMTSQVFAMVRDRLAAEHENAGMISISIDPDHDTPARLADYARRFGASANWTFYTGTPAASLAIQRAFAVDRGDKMNHAPVTFIRIAPGRPWVRLDGLASPEETLRAYRTQPKPQETGRNS